MDYVMSIFFIGFIFLLIIGISNRKKNTGRHKKFFIGSAALLLLSLISYSFVDHSKYEPTAEELAAQEEAKAQKDAEKDKKEQEKEAEKLEKEKQKDEEKAAEVAAKEQKAKEKEEARLEEEKKKKEEEVAAKAAEKEEKQKEEAKLTKETETEKESDKKDNNTEQQFKENEKILLENFDRIKDESDGIITSIQAYDETYDVIYVNVVNEVKLLDDNQKQYLVDELGNKIVNNTKAMLHAEEPKSAVIHVYFKYNDGTKLADAKMLGGWKLK
ncbi:hypothetical protein P4U90_20950 [Cytobacillus kochii]|uniref:hypothetical protein n=1 Tax=Cytobacillus kochii TaxID=859143 RepID=UPI002E1C6950|nr:hypothetical protein [Cytobacillus kochii]